MIHNATITRIDVPAAANRAGEPSYTAGANIAVRCAVDAPSHSQQWTTDAQKLEASAMLMVPLAALASLGSVSIEPRHRLFVRLDGHDARAYLVLKAGLRVKGPLSHVQCWLKDE